ncbi:MAG: hypothetical protein OXQ89_07930 [Rhodospirillaceae bacterium]|nr:hypothetical protein [Rhodospirillaceae bacterium]
MITLATALAALAAILSAICAYLSYRLASQIHHDLKSDERIVYGRLEFGSRSIHHPEQVIYCTVFNKSKRKAYVTSIRAFDRDGGEVRVGYSTKTDHLGFPDPTVKLIGLVDSVMLFITRKDGKRIVFLRVEIQQSFSDSPDILIFDSLKDWSD